MSQSPPERLPLFTIGHSDRTLEEFIDLLRAAGVQCVIDVRKLRGSRAHPHFNEDVLAQRLRAAGVAYESMPALAGRRPVSKDVPHQVNAAWRNRSFHNYADWALSSEFAEAMAQLRDTGRTRATALMCSEAVWWRCHRRIIADHLLAAGEDVRHIMGGGRVVPAELSADAVVAAVVEAEGATWGAVTYPPAPDAEATRRL